MTMVFFFDVKVDENSPKCQITGPALISYIGGFNNLTELSVSVHSPAERMSDSATRDCFSRLQERVGHSLEKLLMCCCSMTWTRPLKTSKFLKHCLRKCEKLVSVQLNRVDFSTSTLANNGLDHSANQRPGAPVIIPVNREPIHWLLDAIVDGLPHLEELDMSGMDVTDQQASSLADKISSKWGGASLRLHTRDLQDSTVENLIDRLQRQSQFHVEYVGSLRCTVLVRRRYICGLFRQLLKSSNAVADEAEIAREPAVEEDSDLDLKTRMPFHRNLYGLTPFDFPIMSAHQLMKAKS